MDVQGIFPATGVNTCFCRKIRGDGHEFLCIDSVQKRIVRVGESKRIHAVNLIVLEDFGQFRKFDQVYEGIACSGIFGQIEQVEGIVL